MSVTSKALAYVPLDRRYALAFEHQLPTLTVGTVLFADISGFTPLTEALVKHYGARRGADELARHFNQVFEELIAKISLYGGSVIGFAGDAITCWFDHQLPAESTWEEPDCSVSDALYSGSLLRALAAARDMQMAMHNLAHVQIGSSVSGVLALKVALSSGSVRRFLVGDPEVQVIEVLAGTLLDRVAAAEQMATAGEIILDSCTLDGVSSDLIRVSSYRQNDQNQQFATLEQFETTVEPVSLSTLDKSLDEQLIRSWVLPPVYARLRNQERFLAEIRPAAALFVRFSGIDYEADPAAEEQLNRYIRWVQSIVSRYQGSLIQLTTGDKGTYLYIAFGAPIAHDDNAERAAATALNLRETPLELAYINRIQIGIAQGRMRVGAYGSQTRQTYAVLGDATNLAARLMSRASYGQILVNQSVAERIAEQFELQDLGFVTLKGKSEPEAISALLRPLTQRAERWSTRYGTPLVGRKEELVKVSQIIAQTVAGQHGNLRIEGEAGIGKSHLAAAVLEEAQRQKMVAWVGTCQSTGQESAYLPVRHIVRQLLNLPGNETGTSEDERQKQMSQVESVLAHMNREWLLRMPLLGELLGLPIPDTPTTAAFDPQLRREALITLVIDMVQSVARTNPVLILVEDVHWIDEVSHEILLGLARSLADCSILLIVLHRPLARHQRMTDELAGPRRDLLERWDTLPNQSTVVLRELTAEGTALLVANRLASKTIAPLALDLIQDLAQGNPFYIEELVDALLDSEQLIPVDGTWILTKSVVSALRDAQCLERRNGEWRLRQGASLSEVDLGIPDSIHGIVLARLDRLPEPVKLTLKVASVIGDIFEFDMLAQSHPSAVDSDQLLEQIAVVEERDFARVETSDPQLSYIFRHNITQEVVYRTLLDEQRRELHFAVGQAVEQLQPNAIERLAYHFFNSDLTRSETRAKALAYLGTAGDRAKRDYANETALTFYDRALGLEERWEWMKSKIELYHLLGQRQEEMELLDYADYSKLGPDVERTLLRSIYYESISEYEEAQKSADLVRLLSRRQNDVANEARGLIQAGQVAGRQGDFDQKEKSLIEALELVKGHQLTPADEIEIQYGLGIVYRERSEYSKAQTALNEALMSARSNRYRQQEALILSSIGFTNQLQGAFSKAYECNRSALSLSQEIGDRAGEGSALISIAQVLLEGKGDIYQAITSLQRALHIQDTLGNLWRKALIWNTLGVAYNDGGEYKLAEDSIQNGLEIVDSIGFEAGRGHLLCNLGETNRESGNLEVALQNINESLNIALRYSDRATQAYSYTELAATQLLKEDYEAAIDKANLALKIQQELKMHSLTASSLAVLGFAYQNLGQSHRALGYIRQCTEILNACQGIGPQYPQRAYLLSYKIFRDNGKSYKANETIRAAYQLISKQAAQISDGKTRKSFLTNVSTNLAIVEIAGELEMVEESQA